MTDLFGDKTMQALSWKQPYASMMLHNKIETRKWKTNYRGLVLICASQQPYKEKQILNISGEKHYKRILDTISKNIGFENYPLTFGKAIAVGNLVDCRHMREEDEDTCFVNYHEDLWCHIYTDVKPIEMIYFKGRQGWTKLEQEFIKNIKLAA